MTTPPKSRWAPLRRLWRRVRVILSCLGAIFEGFMFGEFGGEE